MSVSISLRSVSGSVSVLTLSVRRSLKYFVLLDFDLGSGFGPVGTGDWGLGLGLRFHNSETSPEDC